MVERRLPKPKVASSSLVVRFKIYLTRKAPPLVAITDGSAPREPVKAFVEPPQGMRFGAAQQIVKLGDASSDAQMPNTTTVVDTTRGEVVEAGRDDGEYLSTATLARGRTRFVVAGMAPAGLARSDSAMLATDDAGGTFLTGDGVRGCTVVAYRPPNGGFLTGYQSNDCGGYTPPNVVEGIAATGDSYAELLTRNVGDVGTGPDTLLVQVGRFGRFGAPNLLSSDLLSGFGVVTDRDGSAGRLARLHDGQPGLRCLRRAGQRL